MRKIFRWPVVLRIAGFIMGLISILGGIAAWSYSREPYRYWVAAFVMLASGILWLVCSICPKFTLSKKHYISLLSVLLFGLVFGLVDVFTICGGECGLGAGFCNLYLGYPGRWLGISNCMAGSTGNAWLWIMKGSWYVDFPSFIADIVFWSGAGLMVAVIRDFIKRKREIPAEIK